MSILQEYEMIRNGIGHDKFDAIDIYLKTLYSKKDKENYEKELKTLRQLPLDKMFEEIKKLGKKYNMYFLSDILFNHECWQKFDNWYNEHYLKRSIDIIDLLWIPEFDEMRCNAKLYENGKEVADVIVAYNETDLKYSIGDENSEMNDKFLTAAFKNLINDDFDWFLKLPKLSECSSLMQEIYNNICDMDSLIFHLSYDDWEKYYAKSYSDDLEILKEEIKKYNLEDIIRVDTSEYKFDVDGDLKMRINDDRNINKASIKEEDFVI